MYWGLVARVRSLLLASFFVALATDAFAESCTTWVTSLIGKVQSKIHENQSKARAIDLSNALAVYGIAHQRNDPHLGALALMDAAAVHLRDTPAGRAYEKTFHDLRATMGRMWFEGSQSSGRLVREYTRKRLVRSAFLSLGSNYFKSLLPALIYPLWWAMRYKSNSRADLKLPIFDLVSQGHIPVEQDDFFRDSLKTFYSMTLGRNQKYLGRQLSWIALQRSLQPLILAPLFWYSGVHPLKQITDLIPRESTRSFYVLQFLSQLELEDPRFSPDGKKIAIIVDSDFAVDSANDRLEKIIVKNDDPLMVMTELDYLRAQAGSIQEFVVANVKEFQEARNSVADADILYVVGHGKPGSLGIGGKRLQDLLDETDKPETKSGHQQSVVFISCSYAGTSSDCAQGEPWIQTGLDLTNLNEPVVAGAVTNLTFVYDRSKEPVPNFTMWEVNEILLMNSLNSSLLSATGVYHIDLFEKWRHSQESSKWPERGFRIYDSAVENDEFHATKADSVIVDGYAKLMTLALELRRQDISDEDRRKALEDWVDLVDSLARIAKERQSRLHVSLEVPREEVVTNQGR